MAIFKDSTGRAWTIQITIGSIRRVAMLIPGVNLARLEEPRGNDVPVKLLTELTIDMELLINVVFALIKPQADAASPPITDIAFGEALGGEAVMAAAPNWWRRSKSRWR